MTTTANPERPRTILESFFHHPHDLEEAAREHDLTLDQLAEWAERPESARALATIRTLKATGRLLAVAQKSDSDETQRKAAVELLAIKPPATPLPPAPAPTVPSPAPPPNEPTDDECRAFLERDGALPATSSPGAMRETGSAVSPVSPSDSSPSSAAEGARASRPDEGSSSTHPLSSLRVPPPQRGDGLLPRVKLAPSERNPWTQASTPTCPAGAEEPPSTLHLTSLGPSPSSAAEGARAPRPEEGSTPPPAPSTSSALLAPTLLARIRPRTPAQLHAWLKRVLDLHIPRAPLINSHSAPFDYLCHAFFEPNPVPLVAAQGDQCSSTTAPPPRDCVVWASRAAGKTFLAALATLLDLLFKPAIEVRILAGSLEQARRMHAHLRRFLRHPAIDPLARAHITDRRVTLANSSVAEILAASETSVRGVRPQKLRCDEVELFDPQLWEAAQRTTRSAVINGEHVTASIEAFSTMHRPHGLMARILEGAAGRSPARRLFRWGVVDVLERCPPARPCATCALEPECAGRAKLAEGHLTIDDAITMKKRSSQQSWESEMLCLRPAREGLVLPGFDRSVHVVRDEPPHAAGLWLAAIDFGYHAPSVLLWACRDDAGVLHIVDERVARHATVASHIDAIKASRWPRPAWIAADPAGHQRSDQTGHSAITAMRRASLAVVTRRAGIEEGLDLLRARLTPALAAPRLYIHERCENLIRAIESYHYDESIAGLPRPAKDGPDHAVDALRYLVTCLDKPVTFKSWTY